MTIAEGRYWMGHEDGLAEGEAKGRAEGEAKGVTKGRFQTLLDNIRQLMKSASWSLEQAMEMLNLSSEDKMKLRPAFA